MFGFGAQGRPVRRVELARAATLLALGIAVAAAAQWHRHPAPTSVLRQGAPPYTRPCPIDGGDVVAIVDGGGSLLDSEQARQLILLEEARQCGRLVAQDPHRVRLAGAAPPSAEVRAILADVNRAVCPESSCTYERPALESDVTVVRAALREKGFANAQVRFSAPGDGVPLYNVVFGVPLGDSSCLVSYAKLGVGVVGLDPVGPLRDSGACLR